jgi:hypothetical protein
MSKLDDSNRNVMEIEDIHKQIIETISKKSVIKHKVHDNTHEIFNLFKLVLSETEKEINGSLNGIDHRVYLEYKDHGKFEAQIKVAGDLLIFNMHSNTFEFNREHLIWQNSYAKENPLNTYCGIINIYNFLNDSFRYNRDEDLGYLIARVFVNREFFFLVEGKRQMGYLYNVFGQQKIDKEAVKQIIQSSIQYALEFDLLVPPYDAVKIATVEQMKREIENSKLQTGKRLGFTFNSDDVGKE